MIHAVLIRQQHLYSIRQSANLEYRHSFCSSFWQLIEELHSKGLLYSINAVKTEIYSKKDDLSAWIGKLSSGFFLDEKQAQQEYAEIMQWANAQAQYTMDAKKDFAQADKADAWLIALARKEGMGIISILS